MTDERLKRTDWLILFFCLLIPLYLDQQIKAWVLDTVLPGSIAHIGGFKLHFVRNFGVAGGFLFDLPPLIQTVSLSTLGGFLILGYISVQFLLPVRAFALRTSLTVLLSSILSNVCDRIFHGYIVDYIPVRLGSAPYAVNLADLIQLPLFVVVIYLIIRDYKKIWPAANLRKLSWVEPIFQKRYGLVVISACVASALTGGIFAYSYIRSTLALALNIQDTYVTNILMTFIFWFFLIQFVVLVFFYLLSRAISHRAAGPVYAFNRYVREVLEGKTSRQFKLRGNDDFRLLESLGKDIADKIASLKSQSKDEGP